MAQESAQLVRLLPDMMQASAAKGAEDVAKTLAAEMARLGVGGATRVLDRGVEERYNRRWAKTA